MEPQSGSGSTATEKEEAASFLRSLLNKNLRVTTTDARMFWGQFKCTDPDSNVILSQCYEHRPPSAQKVVETAAAASATASPTVEEMTPSGDSKVCVDMDSRYLGLVVVPGQHIVRIEVEEFTSQLPVRLRQQQQQDQVPAEMEGGV